MPTNPTTGDPFAAPEYQALVDSLAPICQCGCGDCRSRPCDGLLAGGCCDGMGCTCDVDREDDDAE